MIQAPLTNLLFLLPDTVLQSALNILINRFARAKTSRPGIKSRFLKYLPVSFKFNNPILDFQSMAKCRVFRYILNVRCPVTS